MRALKIDTDWQMQELEIPNTLEALQQEVGGLIEPLFTINMPDGHTAITGYVNEEGLITGLPIRLSVFGLGPFAGDLLVVGLDNTTGETIGLTAAMRERVRLNGPTGYKSKRGFLVTQEIIVE